MDFAFTTFPLYEIKDGACVCGDPTCKPGKHPRFRWAELKKGATAPPGPYGICTGSRSDCFVVDLDGDEGLANWEAFGGGECRYTVRTGSGGLHLYFALPGFEVRNSQSKIADGIDIRGEGGFVVGPGSPHASGKTYTLDIGEELVQAPTWLLKRLENVPERGEIVSVVVPAEGLELKRAEALAINWLKKYCEPLYIGTGMAQDWMWHVALKLVKNLKMPQGLAMKLIMEHAPGDKPIEDQMRHALDSAANRSTLQDLGKGIVDLMLQEKKQESYKYSGYLSALDKPQKLSRGALVHHFGTGNDWENVWSYDEFSQRYVAKAPPLKLDAEQVPLTEEDISRILCLIQSQGFTATDDDILKAIKLVSRATAFHPVKEYLQSLPIGNADRAFGYAKELFHNTSEQAGIWVAKFGLAMLERVFNPGCRFDNTLTLVGEEGIRKSSFAQQLGGDWYQGDLADIDNRDGPMSLRGKWVVEIAELAAFKGKSALKVKDFQSRTTDRYRKFQGETEIVQPRQCVFIGTTNDYTFLEGHHGNRRPWPIEVLGRIPEFDRNLFFSDMLALRATGEKHWDEDGNTEQEQIARLPFIEEHPWAQKAKEYCQGRDFLKVGEFQTEVLLKFELGSKDLKNTQGLQKDVNKCLLSIGCKRKSKRIEGVVHQVWCVPEKYSKMPLAPTEERSNVIPFRGPQRE